MIQIEHIEAPVWLSKKVRPGDTLLSINKLIIDDQFDVDYSSLEGPWHLEISKQEGQILSLDVDQSEELVIEVADPPLRQCANQCIFCFIDQLPEGLRSTLYIKDEDYRHSFLYGNFITGTTLTERDIEKIKRIRLSPLYLSVHTTEPDLRRSMLGHKNAGSILELIRRLTQAGITLHTQIVLCPGINDGDHLQRAINDLLPFYPGVATVGIVPLGMTAHRSGLPVLQPVTRSDAADCLQIASDWQKTCLQRFGSRFVFAADEFYLLAGEPIPAFSEYEQFEQIENGIGMLAYLDFYRLKLLKYLAKHPLIQPLSIGFITGISAVAWLDEFWVQPLNRFPLISVSLFPVENRLLGPDVTVSGLLDGASIVHALANRPLPDLLFLPDNCLNSGQLLLDDFSLEMLEKRLNCPVFILDSELKSLLRLIKKNC